MNGGRSEISTRDSAEMKGRKQLAMKDVFEQLAGGFLFGCLLGFIYYLCRANFCVLQIRRLYMHLPIKYWPGWIDVFFRKHMMTPPAIIIRREMFRFLRLAVMCITVLISGGICIAIIHWRFF